MAGPDDTKPADLDLWLQRLDAEHLGAKIRRLREARGWTQEILATNAGVNRSTLASWEKGTRPPIHKLTKLAAALDLPTRKILEGVATASRMAESRVAIWLQRISDETAENVGELRRRFYEDTTGSWDNRQPQDVRIHSLFCKILLGQREYPAAVEEAEFGLTFEPEDYTLAYRRLLAKVHLHTSGAQPDSMLLGELNKFAEKHNHVDAHGLVGRFHRASGDLNQAQQAYLRAHRASPGHYPGGQALVLRWRSEEKLHDPNQWPEDFRDLWQQVVRLAYDAHDYWGDFTEAQLHLMEHNWVAARGAYRRGRARNPPPSVRDCESALGGVTLVIQPQETTLPQGARAQIEEIKAELMAPAGSQVSYRPSPLVARETAVPAKYDRIISSLARFLHDAWVEERLELGWRWGADYSSIDRTHPFMMDWDDLPKDERDLRVALARRAAAAIDKLSSL